MLAHKDHREGTSGTGVAAGLWVDPDRLLGGLARLIDAGDAAPRERSAAVSVARWARATGLQDGPEAQEADSTAEELRGFAQLSTAVAAVQEREPAQGSSALPPPSLPALQACLAARLPDGANGRVANLVTIEGGYSKQTTLFDWISADGSSQALVMRRDVELQHVGTSVAQEYPVVEALHKAGLAVPEPVLLVTGCEGIAQNFMITRRVPGQSIGGPLGGGASAVNPVPALARFFAGLHNIDPATLDVPSLSATPFDQAALEQQVRYWRDRYLAHRQVHSPMLDEAYQWLWDRRALGVQPGAVVHGDGGIYNMLFDGDRFVAMLDWELVHVGSPAWDLSYVRDGVAEYDSFDRFIDLYVEAGGVRPDKAALGYYNVFRLVRSATMCTVGVALFNRGEPVSFDLLNVNLTLYTRLVAALPDAIAEADAR